MLLLLLPLPLFLDHVEVQEVGDTAHGARQGVSSHMVEAAAAAAAAAVEFVGPLLSAVRRKSEDPTRRVWDKPAFYPESLNASVSLAEVAKFTMRRFFVVVVVVVGLSSANRPRDVTEMLLSFANKDDDKDPSLRCSSTVGLGKGCRKRTC
ncbi:unnamed protein product [Lampetra fluviatilis]